MTHLRRQDWFVLSLICVLAAVLRIYKLDASLWYDEVLTLTDFVRLPFRSIGSTYTSLNNHVFFSLQSHLSVAVFGESAWALRLPAALFGIATVPLFWCFVRKAGVPVMWAHISTLLLALNYHHIWFSQNARGYTGLVFWCLLASLLLLYAAKSNDRKCWVWFAIAGALAMYTHLSAAFYLASLFVIFIALVGSSIFGRIKPENDGIRPFVGLSAFVLMGLLTVTLYAPMLVQMFNTFTSVSNSAPDISKNALAVWDNPISSLIESLSYLPLPPSVTLILAPVVLIVLVAGLWRLSRLNGIAGAVVPVSVAVTVSGLNAAGMRIWPRYFLIDVVLMMIVATAGVAVIARLIGRGPGRLTFVLTRLGWSVGILASAVWAVQNFGAPKQDFLAAVEYVNTEADSSDVRASFGLAARPLATYFAPDWDVVQSVDQLVELVKRGKKVWVLYAFSDHSETNFPIIFELLQKDFTIEKSLEGTLGGGTVFVMKN